MKNIMYELYGHEARKRGNQADGLEHLTNQKTETVFCMGQSTKQMLCTRCKGNRIKPATMTGIAGYGSPDQRYFCEDCGYIGSLILDVSEREKSESDIGVENDLINIKKELGLDGERTDDKAPIQIKSILTKGICYAENDDDELRDELYNTLRFAKWHDISGILTTTDSELYEFMGCDFEGHPQKISFEPEAIYIDEDNREIAFTRMQEKRYRVLWFKFDENFESVKKIVKSGLHEIYEEELRNQIIEYNKEEKGLLSVLYRSAGIFIGFLCLCSLMFLFMSTVYPQRGIPPEGAIPVSLGIAAICSLMALVGGLFGYKNMLNENKQIEEGHIDGLEGYMLFKYHEEYDDSDGDGDGGCGCE